MAKQTTNCKSPSTEQQSMDFWQILESACIVYCKWKSRTDVGFSLQFYVSCPLYKPPRQYCWLLPLMPYQYSRNMSKWNTVWRPLSLCQLLEDALSSKANRWLIENHSPSEHGSLILFKNHCFIIYRHVTFKSVLVWTILRKPHILCSD